MLRRLGWLLAAGLIAGSAPLAQASTGAGRLVVAGSRTASTSWTIHSPVHLRTEDWVFGLPSGVLHRTGHIGGVVISRGHDVLFGVVDDASLGGDPLIFGVDDPVLAPGTYTVTMIADAQTTVSLPLQGTAATYRVHPTRPRATNRLSQAAVPDPRLPLVLGSIPIAVPKNALLLIAASVSTHADQAAVSDLCLLNKQEPCAASMADGSGDDFQGQSANPGNLGDGRGTSALFYYPGDLHAGNYFAGVDQATVGLVSAANLLVVTIAL